MGDDFGRSIGDCARCTATIRQLNSLISDQAGSLGLQYVDNYDVPNGHELCGEFAAQELFLNGANIVLDREEGYHPTAFGQGLIADRVRASLQSAEPGTYYNVLPDQTVTSTFEAAGGPVSLSTQWPGSDVVLSLTSPSGRVIDRNVNSADVQHEVGPTFESYHLASTEPGLWTVNLYGARVAPQGELTRLSVWHAPKLNQNPVAALSFSLDGRTVAVDAGVSTDADGNVIDYLWEFGDGTTATGSSVTHTYTTAGTYLTTLAIRDDKGGEAFAAADHTVTISKYDFAGFFQPVAAAPAVSEVKAGRAVPMKFSLGGDYGLGIIQAGSPTSVRVECPTNTPVSAVQETSTAGAGTLSYDPSNQTYNYVWKTDSAWSGTCRTFNMALDDGSVHQSTFRFIR